MMSVIVLEIVVTYPWQVEEKGKKKGGCEVKSQRGNVASRPLPVLCWSEQIEFISHCLIFCHQTRFQLILPVQSQKPPNFKVVIEW